MLCFDHVSFAYPGERTILNDLSFSVSEGEQVGLIGANGAGKSTLMKAALGLITVSGTITIDGLEMNRDNLADIRRRLGYVLQDSDNQMFMPTVFEDMLFGPLNYGMPRPEAEALVDQTLRAKPYAPEKPPQPQALRRRKAHGRHCDHPRHAAEDHAHGRTVHGA